MGVKVRIVPAFRIDSGQIPATYSTMLTRRGLGQYGRDELFGELERVDADDGGHADSFHVEAQDLPEVVAARMQPGHAEPAMSFQCCCGTLEQNCNGESHPNLGAAAVRLATRTRAPSEGLTR